MYSVLQNYVESIKSKAVNHDLTKAVTARLENYKSRVATLQEAALQRKDAALAFVKQYHDLVEDIVGEKREFVVTKAQQVKAQTGDYIETKRTQGQEAVAGVRKGLQERRDKLSASVSEKKERLTSSLAVVAESTLSYTVGVLAIGASVALRVNVAARDAAPPSVLETVDKRVEQLKPYAVRAVNGVQAVDSRLGGYGTAVVKRVSTGVSEKLQQRNSESEATTTTTAEPTATSS